MITAGVEAGSLRRIEAEWTLDDVAMIRDYWKRVMPPVFLSNVAVAAGLGVDLFAKHDDAAPTMEQLEPMGGPSISELSARIKPPVAGGATLSASREVFRQMQGG